MSGGALPISGGSSAARATGADGVIEGVVGGRVNGGEPATGPSLLDVDVEGAGRLAHPHGLDDLLPDRDEGVGAPRIELRAGAPLDLDERLVRGIEVASVVRPTGRTRDER